MTSIAPCRGLSWSVAYVAVGRGARGDTTSRRQDKSVVPAVLQVLDRTCLSACRPVGSRAAPRQITNDFKEISGTVRLLRSAEPSQ